MKNSPSLYRLKYLQILFISLMLVLSGCGSDNDAETPPPAESDTVAPVITLTGESNITINQNEQYIEQGATATDNVDGDVEVSISGEVDTEVVGEYLITYTAADSAGNESTATRTVTVVDAVAPVITLTGESSITINQNEEYIEQGATATDNVDGDVAVNITGEVDTEVVGEYLVTYTATDTAGNVSTATRTVTVVSVTISGTAAGGAAIVGTVVVKGANGNVKSAVIKTDGSYDVDVSGLVAPYKLRAEGTVGGRYYTLHSYATAASLGGTVNITPFTDLIIANAAQQLAKNYFDANTFTALNSAALTEQEDALQAKLQSVFDALGLDAAINLLSSSFRADHSGLDAALDLIRISVNEDTNIATITNTLDGSSITDDIKLTDDNDDVIEVDADKVVNAVTDRVAIANLFADFSSAFDNGLPKEDDISAYFSADFLNNDADLSLFLTDILTDPLLIGLSFNSLSITDLDSDNSRAVVNFNVAFDGQPSFETEKWYVAKDATLGWQFLGDQHIVDLDLINYHCNDNDGTDSNEGACGINTSFSDNDFSNNGTAGEPILSAAVSVISGVDDMVKDTFYLGTSMDSSEGFIYDENSQNYSGDWREFGSNLGQIAASTFSTGDKIQYQLYTSNLDLSDPSMPSITGEAVVTYTREVTYTPMTTGLYPTVPQTTLDNLNNFTLGNDLVVEWTLADGTNIDEVLVEIFDNQGNYVLSIEASPSSSTDSSITFDSAMFDQELLGNDQFQPELGYEVLIRIYAEDKMMPQYYSTDYRAMVEAQATFECGYESGWDENADGGLGAPINPNSFADFKQVIASCGNTVAISKNDLLGESWLDEDERLEFYDTGAATKADPSTAKFISPSEDFDLIWYIETVDTHTFVVIETNGDLDSDLPTDFWVRETYAVTTVTTGQAGETIFSVVIYSEQSNYSDLVREENSDGEIWNNTYIIQTPQ